MQEEQQLTISQTVQLPDIKRRIEEVLGRKAGQFSTALVQIVNSSTQLKDCEPKSVIAAALTAATLDLAIHSSIGHAHLVPYKDNKRGVTVAQFQIGWKGWVQLAMRSGQYRTIGTTIVYEGQLLNYDELKGDLELDAKARKSDKVIGYASFFRLINGYQRTNFWTVEQTMDHAQKYSKAYNADLKYNSSKSHWILNPDAMGLKTTLMDNIRKWGPLSVDMQEAISKDQTAQEGIDVEPVFVDSTTETVKTEITVSAQPTGLMNKLGIKPADKSIDEAMEGEDNKE